MSTVIEDVSQNIATMKEQTQTPRALLAAEEAFGSKALHNRLKVYLIIPTHCGVIDRESRVFKNWNKRGFFLPIRAAHSSDEEARVTRNQHSQWDVPQDRSLLCREPEGFSRSIQHPGLCWIQNCTREHCLRIAQDRFLAGIDVTASLSLIKDVALSHQHCQLSSPLWLGQAKTWKAPPIQPLSLLLPQVITHLFKHFRNTLSHSRQAFLSS